MTEQAIENGGGEDIVAEDRVPLRDDLSGGDQQTPTIVSAGDQLEEAMCAAPFQIDLVR